MGAVTRDQTDFRTTLRRELEARAGRTPGYSLRAFAREIGLAPSRVSEILRGRQGFSRARAVGLERRELEAFCDQVEASSARSAVHRELARVRLRRREIEESFHPLQEDAIRAASDWYHYAILHLIELPAFENRPAWIASALGIRPAEAEAALDRLRRLGLVEETRGRLRLVHEFIRTTDGVPSESIRALHRQILMLAVRAQEEQPIAERSHSAVFLPFDRRRMGEAVKDLVAFRRRFCRKYGAAANGMAAEGSGRAMDAVYGMAIQFFSLTPALPATTKGKPR